MVDFSVCACRRERGSDCERASERRNAQIVYRYFELSAPQAFIYIALNDFSKFAIFWFLLNLIIKAYLGVLR